ncbi:MAG TPA: hypothetical protein VI136_06475 [Verrucomicrobiae bacterium]
MTYFLLLLAAFAVAGVGWAVRRRSALCGQVLIGLGCVGCLAVVGWQVRQSLFPADAKPPSRAHAVVSFYLASQTQREIAGQRGTVVVILPPASQLDAETAENYVNALRAPLLRGHPELELEIARLNVPAKAAKTGTLPLAAFQQVVAQYPKALAFVCYASVPPDIESLFPTDPQTMPPFFLFDPLRGTNWLGALKQNHIRCVIVPRPDVNPAQTASVSGMPGEIFGQFYLMATPANATQIATTLASTTEPNRPR